MYRSSSSSGVGGCDGRRCHPFSVVVVVVAYQKFLVVSKRKWVLVISSRLRYYNSTALKRARFLNNFLRFNYYLCCCSKVDAVKRFWRAASKRYENMNEINEVSGIDGMIRDGRVPVCICYSLAALYYKDKKWWPGNGTQKNQFDCDRVRFVSWYNNVGESTLRS